MYDIGVAMNDALKLQNAVCYPLDQESRPLSKMKRGLLKTETALVDMEMLLGPEELVGREVLKDLAVPDKQIEMDGTA